MIDQIVTRYIPVGRDYPGLLAHQYAPDREIVVIGAGPEAERILEEAVIRKRVEGGVSE